MPYSELIAKTPLRSERVFYTQSAYLWNQRIYGITVSMQSDFHEIGESILYLSKGWTTTLITLSLTRHHQVARRRCV